MALYFECQINKNALLRTVFFGDFSHWESFNTLNYKANKCPQLITMFRREQQQQVIALPPILHHLCLFIESRLETRVKPTYLTTQSV